MMTRAQAPQMAADISVVRSNLRPIRGAAGAPRHPLAESGAATGRVPNGSTANSTVHQIRTNKTLPLNQFIVAPLPQLHELKNISGTSSSSEVVRKQFFFEKKNQKTFILSVSTHVDYVLAEAVKVFWYFFKKELPPSFFASLSAKLHDE
jgi:hypothetical protein